MLLTCHFCLCVGAGPGVSFVCGVVRHGVGEQVLDNYEDIKLGELHGIDAKKVGGAEWSGFGAICRRERVGWGEGTQVALTPLLMCTKYHFVDYA